MALEIRNSIWLKSWLKMVLFLPLLDTRQIGTYTDIVSILSYYINEHHYVNLNTSDVLWLQNRQRSEYIDPVVYCIDLVEMLASALLYFTLEVMMSSWYTI